MRRHQDHEQPGSVQRQQLLKDSHAGRISGNEPDTGLIERDSNNIAIANPSHTVDDEAKIG